jgi:hypothetical protein
MIREIQDHDERISLPVILPASSFCTLKRREHYSTQLRLAAKAKLKAQFHPGKCFNFSPPIATGYVNIMRPHRFLLSMSGHKKDNCHVRRRDVSGEQSFCNSLGPIRHAQNWSSTMESEVHPQRPKSNARKAIIHVGSEGTN